MHYRLLGNTGLKASVIGVGTHQFAGEWGKKFTVADVDKILGRAGELGINLIETAECYGDHHLSESLIGPAIRADRKKWILVTKFGHKYDGPKTVPAWSAGEVLKQLEDSLRALQTDYIDVYHFHSGSNQYFDNAELWTMLYKQRQAGKIRHLGISIVHEAVMANDLHQIESAAKNKVGVIQVVYNRLNRQAEEKVFPMCQKQNFGVIARVPLAKGFLSGRYQPGFSFPADDIRSSYAAEFNLKQLQLVEEIKNKEVPPGVDMAQWALAWCLKHPAVSSVIPGSKSAEQVENNARAVTLI